MEHFYDDFSLFSNFFTDGIYFDQMMAKRKHRFQEIGQNENLS